jgi:hypothetical protein
MDWGAMPPEQAPQSGEGRYWRTTTKATINFRKLTKETKKFRQIRCIPWFWL